MRVVTVTKSQRPQTRTIVSSDITIHGNTVKEVTIVVPFQDVPKELYITFNEQELRDMLSPFEAAREFNDILRGKNTPNTPDSSGTSGSLV